jgi:hypothetical protein
MKALNPLSIEVLGNLDSERYKEEIRDLAQKIAEEDGARAGWVTDVRKIRKLISGKDKRRNKPWKHASETNVPMIKKHIRRWKPTLYNLFALADPVCAFHATTPKGADAAPTAEMFFNWLVKVHMDNSDTEVQYLTDDVGSDGMGNLAVEWDYRTELRSRVLTVDNLFPGGPPQDEGKIIEALRKEYEIVIMPASVEKMLIEAARKILDGNKFVKVTYVDVVTNKPRLVSYNGEYVIVPSNCKETHTAEYVALLNQLTVDDLRQKARDGILDEAAVEKFLESRTSDDEVAKTRPAGMTSNTDTGPTSDEQKLRDAGVQPTEDNKISVYKVYCKLDLNGDGIKERAVIWMSIDKGAPYVLALHPFAYSVPFWPVIRFDFEKAARGPYKSQGIGHLLLPLQKELNKQFRAKSDAIDIQLAPMFKRLITGGMRSRNVTIGPGKIIDVTSMDAFMPMEKSPFNLHEYLNNEQMIENQADTLIGSLVNDLQATGRKLERRTASEVARVGQTSEAMAGMDAASFQNSMRLVFQAVWQLWLDLGPRTIYYTVTGKKTPQLFNKGDFSKNYELIPTGTPGNTDRQKQLSYVMQLIELAMKDPSRSINLPYLVRRAVQLIDPKMADVALVPQATQQALATIQQAAALIQSGDLPPDVQGLLTSGATNMEAAQ